MAALVISVVSYYYVWLIIVSLQRPYFFTFSSHTEYVKTESIEIARLKKIYFFPFDECSCFVCLRTQNKQKNFRLSVCLYVRRLGRLQNLS